MESWTYAEKSADPVAASVASVDRRACQTAPLWPMNVPILQVVSSSQCLSWNRITYQSPVMPSRSIGLLSAES